MRPYYASVTIHHQKTNQKLTKDIVCIGQDLNRDSRWIKRVLGKGGDPDGWKVIKVQILKDMLGI